MSAVLTRAGTSSFGAVCEQCRATLHSTTKRRAQDWAQRHNNRWHRQTREAPKGAFLVGETKEKQ